MSRNPIAAIATAFAIAGGTLASPAIAQVRVFACEPEWAALGGGDVVAHSATHGRQDAHHVRARPSLIAKVRRADVLFCFRSRRHRVGSVGRRLRRVRKPHPSRAGLPRSHRPCPRARPCERLRGGSGGHCDLGRCRPAGRPVSRSLLRGFGGGNAGAASRRPAAATNRGTLQRVTPRECQRRFTSTNRLTASSVVARKQSVSHERWFVRNLLINSPLTIVRISDPLH